eukprot:TRINITY_DN6778_c0_g2_i2.p1 TRINITY_DN6778_c0_g2~~TRINITY_DN6778_c0_g2_i2.p1  ORF type:complete len:425 (+),score=86.32 TRINITY_DN6778_c0_g2_i2:84-1277(+)
MTSHESPGAPSQPSRVPPPPPYSSQSSLQDNFAISTHHEYQNPEKTHDTSSCDTSESYYINNDRQGQTSDVGGHKGHEVSARGEKDDGYGVRTSFVGIKRKGLANELMDGDSVRHHVNWTKLWDVKMPGELMASCKPLHCELCQVNMSSPIQSKMHYQGKIHDKHVKSWFIKQGVSQQNLPVKMDSSGKFPRWEVFSCDVCNISFDSNSVLQTHILGKNHKRLAARAKDESIPKPSVFNKETKRWERTKIEPSTPSQKQESLLKSPPSEFYCDLCKVSAPNNDQFQQHVNGKNHKKKMSRSMSDVKEGDMAAINKRMQFKETVMSKLVGGGAKGGKGGGGAISKGKGGNPKFASYRTPSGGYYCGACNVSAQSEAMFLQHFTSKSHKHKEMVMKARH